MADVQNNNFPFEIQDLDPETNAILKEHFEDEFDGFIRVGPKGYFMPKVYQREAPTLYNMQTRPDQLFVGGYPRSGTTWTQQLVWLIINDLDYAECEKTRMEKKFIYLEMHAMVHQKTALKHALKNIHDEKKMESMRTCYQPIDIITKTHSFYKTHLPLSILPPKLLETSKMVYVARDPRDVIVSFYYFTSGGFWEFKRDFKAMWNNFLKGTMFFCPYFEHVKEAWKKRHNPNLLFLFYEDIQDDRLATLRRVADFFNKSYTDEQLLGLSKYLDFNNLKDKKTFNIPSLQELGIMKPQAAPFVRKGKVGGWREHFDEEMSREADQWIADNLRNTDLRFPSLDI